MGKMEDAFLLQQQELLMKKAEELSLSCDVNIGLILFSPKGGLSEFANGESLEDMYLHFLSQSPKIRGFIVYRATAADDCREINNEENIIQSLLELKRERLVMKKITMIQDIWEEAVEVNLRHQAMKKKLSLYNPNIKDLESLEDVYECEHFIARAIEKIHDLKTKKQSQHGTQAENGEESMVKTGKSQEQVSPPNSKKRVKNKAKVEPNQNEDLEPSSSNVQGQEHL